MILQILPVIYDLIFQITYTMLRTKRGNVKNLVKSGRRCRIPKRKTRVLTALLAIHFSLEFRQKKMEGQRRNRMVRSEQTIERNSAWPITTTATGKTVIGCLAERANLFVETRKTIVG